MNKDVALDLEWISLIKQAKDLGVSKEEVRAFLSRNNNESVMK